jgi:hypothetical protein
MKMLLIKTLTHMQGFVLKVCQSGKLMAPECQTIQYSTKQEI